ncbi:hypothetical protein ACFL45_04000 [Candidatus Neomarinimicrobiota bacterium]
MKAKYSILTLLVLFTLSDSLWSQEAEQESAVGYLRIFVDTDLVQIFLDGEMIGYTPILEKIPVTTGWHHLSFFSPDFKYEHWTHRQERVLVNIVEAGTYRVLVKPGELHEVHMDWHKLGRELDRYESGKFFSTIIGIIMVAATMLLLSRAV